MIRGLFGRSGAKPALPEERGPLACAIGGALQLDTLSLQAALAGGEPAMEPPEGGVFIVSAIGTARLDGANELTRYYDDEGRILQVIAPFGGGRETMSDLSLYRGWDSVVPAGTSDWARWTGRDGLIGAPSYDADGLEYARYWGDGDGHTDLVEFTETVDDGERRRDIHQRCMLYARPIGSVDEMLLINIETELGAAARREGSAIEFMIGYGLGAADVQRV
ncbi:DUF2491 family protein [Tsuneonella amylolytica]|uniref:DUF2491 family protein n=1 Tax=Tsuneonella amylolytica TaxID=2338327 RepID=UPI000EA9C74C|nr:DUF2491 family protein [Tsuneonella amylolytica]